MKAKYYLKNLYRKSHQGKFSRKNYLRLDMNEGLALPEELVKDILTEVTPEFIAMYPEDKTLQIKIAARNNLKPENICLANGSDAAIKYVFDAYVSAGDKVLFTEPTFAMYSTYCKMFNAKPVTIKYKEDLSFPFAEFMERINPRLKLAVLVNPNNPTGTALGYSQISEIIKRSAKLNVMVIVDEAYFYFYPHTVIEEVKKYDNLIVLRTFSKLCSMASLRLGYAAGCPLIIRNLTKVKPTYDVNGLAAAFAEKLLDKPYIISSLIESANKGKKYLIQKLLENDIEYRQGKANFVLIRCGKRTGEIIKKLKDKNVLVGGKFKHAFLKDCIRVTIADLSTIARFWGIFINIWKPIK